MSRVQTIFPAGTVVKCNGIPCELPEDTPYYSATFQAEAERDDNPDYEGESIRKRLRRGAIAALGLAVLIAALALTTCAAPAHALGTDRYDPEIRDAAEQWLPGADWLRYRSLLYQESQLDPGARSSAGAEGIAQFMSGTWAEVAPALGHGHLTRRHARAAIEAGAYYLARQMRIWTEDRPYIEKRRLGEASYNAGAGNIIQAQRVCRQGTGPCIGQPGRRCRYWSDIGQYLHHVTGHHADETRTYIRRIERWLRVMRAQR